MKLIVSICIAVLCYPTLFGQSAEEKVIDLKQRTQAVIEENASVDEAEVPGLDKERKGNWNFSVGTSFSYMKGYGSGMALYAAPTFTLPLNDRWSLHGGVVATQYQSFNGTVPGIIPGETFLPNSFTSLSLFAAASYRMNDRLVLHGAGVKRLVSAPESPFTPYPMDNLSLGATYKLGDNITIGASINMNTGRYGNGYYGNPMNGYMMPSSPFGW
ncbi:MAG: hypothetical protein DRI98_06570 [Bacteroidetes bacterium]|nr:MAG: hypothetical protein DRI98_06570 [Bacteroidota bacterium]